MVALRSRKSVSKYPAVFSHEFIIQNHADIVSCITMIFVVGLMIQATSPWAYIFIALHHNISSMGIDAGQTNTTLYTTGWKDICAVFFYLLIAIVLHAVLQEYIFDKISKKLRLSKIKLSKFNESSQLLTFYILSIIWGVDIIIRESYLLKLSKMYMDHPVPMTFSLKFFFIGQLAYWAHCFPELYFQRVRSEEFLSKFLHAIFGFSFTTAAYVINFQHCSIIAIVLHHFGEAMLHIAHLIGFIAHKERVSKIMFVFANAAYFIVRFATVGLSTLIIFHGSRQSENINDSTTDQYLSSLRTAMAVLLIIFQIYLSLATLKKIPRSSSHLQDVNSSKKLKLQKSKLKKKEIASKKNSPPSTYGEGEMSDGDQSTRLPTRRSLRSRTPKPK